MNALVRLDRRRCRLVVDWACSMPYRRPVANRMNEGAYHEDALFLQHIKRAYDSAYGTLCHGSYPQPHWWCCWPGGWQFTWSDEFDRTGTPLVSNVWKWDGGGSMVRDARLDRANGYCSNGLLVLEAKRLGTNQYTSAAISTIGLKSWLYGRFEMRGRIDIRSGSWPAWWTTGVSGGWPAGGEIDMMEYYTDKLLFNVMNGKRGWANPTLSAKALGGAAWASQFHTWIMEWDATRIDLSLDGRLVNHYLLTNADGTGPNGANPFKAPQYMRVNLAIGQTGGDPSATEFPMKFEVDYIRTWQWVDSTACVCTVDGGTGTGPLPAGDDGQPDGQHGPGREVI